MGIISRIKQAFRIPIKKTILRDFGRYFSFYNTKLATNETIFSAVGMLSNAIASAPVGIYIDGKKLKPSENYLAKMFKFGPNRRSTMFDFIKTMEVNRCTKGAGYAIKEIGYAGATTGLWLLNSDYVTPILEKDTNELYYEVRDETGINYIHNSYIIQVTYMTSDGYTPINPLDVLKNTIDYDKEVKEFSINQMKKGLKANLVVKLQSKLSQDDIDEYDEMMQRMMKNGVVYVDSGKEFQELKNTSYIDPNVAAVEQITVERVERVYNMPGKLTKGSSNNKSTTTDTEDLLYLKDTILPVIRMYEQEFSKKLLNTKQILDDYEIKFSMNGYARATMEKRGNFYQQMIRGGIMTINEVRSLEDLPKVEGGDTRYLSRDLCPSDLYEDFITKEINGGKVN